MKELWIHDLFRCGNCFPGQFSRKASRRWEGMDGLSERRRERANKTKIKSRGRGRPRHIHHKQKSSRPTVPCDGPRMNPSVDVGCPPRPFRHLRMAQRRTPDLSSSRAPVHSALVQKSVTAITNPAGRLSMWMLGNSGRLGKWKTRKRWQVACNESNLRFTRSALCRPSVLIFPPSARALNRKARKEHPQSSQGKSNWATIGPISDHGRT